MALPDRLRLPMSFDPEPLARDLAGLDGWIAHFVAQNYDGDWSVLPLRGTAGARHPVMAIYPDPAATAFEDTALLARCPNIRAVLERFLCPLHFVRLMRLTPGSVIKEHRDYDLDAEAGMARLHLPIVTNTAVVFEVNRRPVALEPGSVWYLRLSDPHRVSNLGTSDRIHLVIDAPVNDWLGGLLRQAAEAANASASTAS